jgi:hypothetical protein
MTVSIVSPVPAPAFLKYIPVGPFAGDAGQVLTALMFPLARVVATSALRASQARASRAIASRGYYVTPEQSQVFARLLAQGVRLSAFDLEYLAERAQAIAEDSAFSLPPL